MPEQLEVKSLTRLAHENSRARESDAGNKAKIPERKDVFDGFLKTFLGDGKTSDSGKSSSRTGSQKPDDGEKAAKLTRRERRAVREAMEKTDAESDYIDEEIAAAAEEAAKMIWNLLYPGSFTTGLIAIPGADSLAALSNLIAMSGHVGGASLTRMNAGELSGEAVGGAIETANASAEMNRDAVLSSLEEMLDGMPRSALRQALAGVAGVDGRYDVFARIAGVLDAKVLEVDGPAVETDPGRILSQLGMDAERRIGAFAAAENAGPSETAIRAYEYFQQFLRENFPGSSAANLEPKQMEDLFEAFARRLMNGNRDGSLKEFLGEVGGIARAAAADLPKGSEPSAPGGGATADKVFAWIRENLESSLQNGTGDGGENDGGNDRPGDSRDNAALLSGQAFSAAMAAAQSGSEPGESGDVGSMLRQMENIERLADAMKLANRGGVTNLTLQLAPVELGKVLLRVEARNGVVTASLRVEKAEAVLQLSEGLGQLRRNLEAHGIELGEFDIRQHDFGYGGGHGGGGFESAESERPQAVEEAPEVPDFDPGGWRGGGLNLFA